MASRFSQSSGAVSNHLMSECSSCDEGDRNGGRVTETTAATVASSSYGNGTVVTVTSMAYLPQTVVLCELRHEAFERCVPSGPLDSGLVSKWRPKDRVRWFMFWYLSLFCFLDCFMLYLDAKDGYFMLYVYYCNYPSEFVGL